jgi:hypothetical protein
VSVDLPNEPAATHSDGHSSSNDRGGGQSTSTTTHAGNPSATGTASTAPQPTADNATSAPTDPVKPRDWGSIAGKDLRPGIAIRNGQCTSNFLFQENWTRFFLGTAAHCVSTIDDTLPDAMCHGSAWDDLGSQLRLNPRGDTGLDSTLASLAYNSVMAMTTRSETAQPACEDNDFALLEISNEDLPRVHPAVLYYGGPTALDNMSLVPDDDVYFFGHSGIREGNYIGVPATVYLEQMSPQHIVFAQYAHDGWDFDWNNVLFYAFEGQPTRTQDVGPIPGDSGGPFLGPQGTALAMLGGGANNLRNALDYMQAHEGWAPELVTWDEFSPTGIEPLRNGP